MESISINYLAILVGAVMWTNEKQKWTRFFIQGGYQLVIFIVFGLLLQYWK